MRVLKTSRLLTTSICGKHLSHGGYLPRCGNGSLSQVLVTCLFPPAVGRCDITQITIHLSSENFYCEHKCLPNKPVMETLRRVFAWLPLQCRITGAFIRCAYGGYVACEKPADCSLRVFMDIYRTKFCIKFLGHLSFPRSAICLPYEALRFFLTSGLVIGA